MPNSLSIKNVPDEVLTRLRERARRNHRSLQGELLTLLEEAVADDALGVDVLASELEALELNTPEEAAELLRELRDGR